MRRLIICSHSLALAIAFAACGDPATEEPAPPDDVAGEPAAPVEALAPDQPFTALEPPPDGAAPAAAASVRVAYAGVRIDVDVDVARTVVTEVLVNDLEAPAEASFRFPLPDDATVTDFAHFDGERRVAAALGDKAAARRELERAAAAGEKAGLAEADPGRQFTMTLAQLAPGESRRVELTYVQTLSPLGGERSLALPVRRLAAESPTLLDVVADITAPREITSMVAPNQPDARITRVAADHRRVHLARSGRRLESDLVVRWSHEVGAVDLDARAVRPDPKKPGIVEVRFALNRDPSPGDRTPANVVVVIDHSLSMAGQPLARARAAAAKILDGLGPADSIGLVSFADEVATVELRPVAPDVRQALGRSVEALTPKGGSNLAAALDEAAQLLSGRPNGLLVLLSDGEATVGAGSDGDLPASSSADLKGVRAVVGHFNYPTRTPALTQLFPAASVRFVPDGKAGDQAVDSLVRLAIAPTVSGFTVELDGAEKDSVHGGAAAELAVGESVRLVARAAGDVTVRVRGTMRGRPLSFERVVTMPAGPDPAGDRGLPLEWARLRVADLETRYEASPTSELEQEIRALATEHRLATRFTSFVYADSLSPDRIKPGDPELRVRAPAGSEEVLAVLPWGETVVLGFEPDEGLWLGRFLVPRGTPDGLYKVRVFVVSQGRTALRSTLFYRVDSAPPTFTLDARYAGGRLLLRARPTGAVFEPGPKGDELRLDRVDLRRVAVVVEGVEIELEPADDGTWTAELAMALPSGRHRLRLVATDYAANSSTTTARVTVE